MCGSPPQLYVVLPYFNFCGFKRRRQLFIEFVERMKSVKNIRIIVSAASPLPRLPVYRQLSFKPKNSLWIKENLVNLAADHLPSDWKYIAWIDADLTFLNSNWVRDTLEALELWDIVQLFHTAVNLGPRGEAFKTDKSFAYMYRKSGTPYVKTDKYGFWHPGYAWACTRKAWDQMGGLLDWAILGSGDRHMAMAWIGRVRDSCPGNVHPDYLAMLDEYQVLCKGLEISNIDGTILHHWHGSLENRKYRERWSILTSHKFTPVDDIVYNSRNMIELTTNGLRLSRDLSCYFAERKEDDLFPSTS